MAFGSHSVGPFYTRTPLPLRALKGFSTALKCWLRPGRVSPTLPRDPLSVVSWLFPPNSTQASLSGKNMALVTFTRRVCFGKMRMHGTDTTPLFAEAPTPRL